MFTVIVEAGFSAMHQLRLAGGMVEPQHGHDWIVRAYFCREELSEEDMVVDFTHAQAALRAVLATLHHADLNAHAALAGLNPTAEVIARHVFEQLSKTSMAGLRRVEVTEAPGCVAAYEISETVN